jgi:hypothetical protein
MKKYLQLSLGMILWLTPILTEAQTLSDAIMMKQREICFALGYDHGTWDHYWEGPDLRVNDNIGTLTRNTTMAMVAYGITNKLNALVTVPYVQTKSSGGQLAGVNGFQDISLALKYEAFNTKIGKGKLIVLPVGVFSTPMTNYLSDYQPYSLGLGTTEWALRGIVQYELDNGIYTRGSVAHLWRGQTEVERDYYYNNGSYYTSFMDIPNAWNYQGTLGAWLFKYALQIEATYFVMNSTSGDDIRAYNAPQPTNKVEFSQVNFFAHYFFKKKVKGLGILGYYSQMLDGRNMGKFANLGGGFTYQFKL